MARRFASDHLLTVADYEQLPDDARFIDELSRGRLVREPRPGQPHGRVQIRLGGLLSRFVDERQLGYVTVESGFVLGRDPDTLRGPDIAFVAREKYGNDLPSGFAEFAPDLAVEILSPSDRRSEMAEKIAQYFDAGTRMVWVIDPADRSAVVYRGAGEVSVARDDAALDGGDALRGFSVRLPNIFD